MFNRLRKFKDQIPGGTSPVNASKNEIEQSGFICPMCMTQLKSAEDLQTHFEEKHSEPNPDDSQPLTPSTPSNQVQPSPHLANNEMVNMLPTSTQQNGDPSLTVLSASNSNQTSSVSSPDDSLSLRDEINNLKTSLEEEKWYSAELKKELGNVKIEKDKAFEESSTIQKQMAIAMATNEELAKQKESLEKKASRMAQSLAELKAMNDDYQSQKKAAEERSQNQSVELEKAATWVRDLESQLLQRPGADDVMVLKKELVSVQTLMDQMTLESEEKGKEVEKERQDLQNLLDEARSQAQLVQEEFDAFKAENARLKCANEESNIEKLESLRRYEDEKEKFNQLYNEFQITKQEELKNLESSLEKEQSYSKSLEVETNRLQEDKIAMEKDINRLTNEFNEMVRLCEKDKKNLQEMSSKIEELKAAKIGLENKLELNEDEFKKVHAQQLIALSDKEARYDEICAERDDVQCQLDKSTDTSAELKRKNEELKIEKERLRIMVKQSETESSSTQQQLQLEIAQLKILLDKLIGEKKQLIEDKSGLERSVDMVRKSQEEERNALQAQLLESERRMISFKLKASQFEEEIGQKLLELNEWHSKVESLQTAYDEVQSKSHLLHTELALKTQQVETLQEKLMKSLNRLDEEVERREKASEDAAKLREERSHLMAQMEAGEGEAVARAQIAKENELLRDQKEKAEERWKREISEQEQTISELRRKMNETSLLLNSTQEQLHSTEQTIVQLRDAAAVEREKLVQAETEVKAKNELLTSTEIAAATQRADIENHMNSVKRALEDKSRDYMNTNDQLLASRTLLDELKNEMSDLRQNHHMEVAHLRSKADVLEKEKNNVIDQNEKVKKEMEQMRESHLKENERRMVDVREVESRLTDRVSSLKAEICEARNEISHLSDDKKVEESIRTRVEVELNQTKRKLQESDETRHAFRIKLEGALEALESARVELQTLQDENASLSEKLESEKIKALAELESLKVENEKEKKLLKEESETIRTQWKAALELAQSKIDEKEAELNEMRSSFDQVRAERMETEAKLTSDVSSHVESLSKLMEEFDRMKRELNTKNSLLDDNKVDIERLEVKLKDIASEMDERTTLLTETEVELENVKSELLDARMKIKSLHDDSCVLNNDKTALQQQVEDHVKTNKELEGKLILIERSNSKLTEESALYKERCQDVEEKAAGKMKEFEEKEECFQTQINNLQGKLEKLNVELKIEIANKEAVSRNCEEMIGLLREEVEEKENLWNVERKNFHEKIQSLEAAQSLSVSHKVELTGKIEVLQTSLDHEKKLLSKSEENAKASAKAKDDVIDAMKSQLESKNRELESAEADRVVAESRLQLEIGTLTENLNSTRAEWVACTQRIDTMSRDNDDLKGEMLVLNTTIQNNNDERRALLERCLQAEQQSEDRNAQLADVRRKLGEAHSAMHELGRENQALQVKHKTTISRQWTDDRSANQCRACARAFSITVRRHHCRHCGDIFCNECSSRSATVAASKNPVRVCERCYDELLTAG